MSPFCPTQQKMFIAPRSLAPTVGVAKCPVLARQKKMLFAGGWRARRRTAPAPTGQTPVTVASHARPLSGPRPGNRMVQSAFGLWPTVEPGRPAAGVADGPPSLGISSIAGLPMTDTPAPGCVPADGSVTDNSLVRRPRAGSV